MKSCLWVYQALIYNRCVCVCGVCVGMGVRVCVGGGACMCTCVKVRSATETIASKGQICCHHAVTAEGYTPYYACILTFYPTITLQTEIHKCINSWNMIFTKFQVTSQQNAAKHGFNLKCHLDWMWQKKPRDL